MILWQSRSKWSIFKERKCDSVILHPLKLTDTKDTGKLLLKLQELIKLFSGLINNKHKGFASASGKGQEIIVKLNKPVTTNSDIKELIAVINTMYTAYLVSANLGK